MKLFDSNDSSKYDIFDNVKEFDPKWLYRVFHYFVKDFKKGIVNEWPYATNELISDFTNLRGSSKSICTYASWDEVQYRPLMYELKKPIKLLKGF